MTNTVTPLKLLHILLINFIMVAQLLDTFHRVLIRGLPKAEVILSAETESRPKVT